MARIVNLQTKPVLADKERNLKNIDTLIGKASDKSIDLVVMPEFFSTGIHQESFLNAPEDENGGKTIEFISNLAKKYNTNIIAGSVIEKSKDKLYNTSFAINRSGEIVGKYRKIHLFNYMGGTEGERITPGNEIKTVDFDFAKVGMAICFDIRFPMHFKKLAKMKAQIVVLPTAWIVPVEIFNDKNALSFAKDTFMAMAKVRAYDNSVYFVLSNQIGQIGDKIGAIGCSSIIAPTSQILAQNNDSECALCADIDVEVVDYYRKIFPVAEID